MNVIWLKSVDSTNTWVKNRLAEETLTADGVVAAELQTAGRGRGNNTWESDKPLGLWASLYRLKTTLPLFHEVAALSVAIVNALREKGAEAVIKWPNDVLVGRKKICGILAEQSDGALIAGFGVNLLHHDRDFPENLDGLATSLFLCTGQAESPALFLERVIRQYRQPESGTLADYRKHLGIIGEAMAVDGIPVVVENVAESGALLCRLDSGETRTFHSGTLRWR